MLDLGPDALDKRSVILQIRLPCWDRNVLFGLMPVMPKKIEAKRTCWIWVRNSDLLFGLLAPGVHVSLAFGGL